MSEEGKVIPVRVALRSRPLVQKEIIEGCQMCIRFVSNEPQVIVGTDKAFTYDYVFPPEASQSEVYNMVIVKLIDKLFKGYNVTVLAYGQTGSGKTYTMGTTRISATENDESKVGIIPRAVQDVFNFITQSDDAEYTVKISFLEIYKEDVYDLLNNNREKDGIAIRENFDGGIKIVGLTELPAKSPEETMMYLEMGTLNRTTAATAMNFHSSRSHAIFTISLEQHKISTDDIIHAKFHFVDLAGSERAKKTGAQGERFKEGVNINRGLLALGNVISSLCDESSHIPYRDSKLTRLLQDSLGGNSHTVMIACISPADFNLDETVNTLRYADRARKIKNKPIINRDLQSAELAHLKQLVQQLQLQLLQGQSSPSSGSIRSGDFQLVLDQNKKLEEENRRLAKELQNALNQTTTLCEKVLLAEMTKDMLLQKLDELKNKTRHIIDSLSHTFEDNPEFQDKLQLVRELQEKIIDLQIEQSSKSEITLFSPVKKEQEVTSVNNNAIDQDQSGEESESDEFQLQVTLRQAAMSRELQELEHALALKEDLASRMKESDSQMSIMRMQYENSLKQLEEEVSKLQMEKEELTAQLRVVHTNTVTNKVSEQRRKRLQELETQICRLKKEMTEKSRLLKMKEEADSKVNILQQEIQSMKQTRVRLLRQMKEEAEKYRHWKLQKDRELARLKQQDRKRQFELLKMEKMYTKQHNVLKRKMEEATAANKRLQNAIQLQRTTAERREKEKDQNMQNLGNRIRQWLQQELDVVVSSREANYHLGNLLEDRKAISEQLNHLKDQLKSSMESTNDSSHEDVESLERQVIQFQQDLQLRNAQISDLQQRILDADQDEKAKHRWESIHSMVESKCALKWLFENAANCKIQMVLSDNKNREIQNNLEDLMKTNDELQKEIETLKVQHQEQIVSQAREHEDKTLYLLKQMQHSTSSDLTTNPDIEASLIERIKFQENEITRLSYLHEELQEKSEECEALKKKLTLARYKGERASLMPDVSADASKAITKPQKTKTAKRIAVELSESESDEPDSDSNDPDWERTPYAIKRHHKKISKIEEENSKENQSSDDNKNKIKKFNCKCNRNCEKKNCGCRRTRRNCSDICKCDFQKCRNRDNTSQSFQQSSCSGDTMLNTTFNVTESKVDEQNDSDMHKILSKYNKDVKHFKLPLSEDTKDTLTRDENILATEGIIKKKRRMNNTTFFKPV